MTPWHRYCSSRRLSGRVGKLHQPGTLRPAHRSPLGCQHRRREPHCAPGMIWPPSRVETTRFHPTFFYESIWNMLAAVLIIWLVRKFGERSNPVRPFISWLLLEGVGRVWLEFFRPDQPRIPGTDLSYSRLVALMMALAGAFLLMVRFEKIKLPFMRPGPENYERSKDKKWKK